MELGIDCGGTKCEGIALDKGVVKDYFRIEKPSTKEVLFKVIDALLSRNKGVKFIGIGFPAPVNNGFVQVVNNVKGWSNTNIEHTIQKKYKIKCKVENDAKCFALFASSIPENRKHKCVIGITLGTGIGCGIMINGKIWKGMTGAAGEICRIPYNGKSLEDFTSKKFFFQNYKKDAYDIFSKPNNSVSRKAINGFSLHLGRMLTVLTSCFEPECIVFGGSISKSFRLFEKNMKKELEKHIYKQTYEKIKIKNNSDKYALCKGAAMLQNF
jgi:glucokinase